MTDIASLVNELEMADKSLFSTFYYTDILNLHRIVPSGWVKTFSNGLRLLPTGAIIDVVGFRYNNQNKNIIFCHGYIWNVYSMIGSTVPNQKYERLGIFENRDLIEVNEDKELLGKISKICNKKLYLNN